MAENEVGFYDEVAGKGFENMGADKFAIPMLLIAQMQSSVTTADNSKVKAGDFYNSITGESYGTSVTVVPIYFNSVWLEWKPNMGGLVGRHAPYSVKVTGDAYTGMKTADGNDIQESWCYFVLIKGRENDGPLMFSATSSNIRYAKVWNGMLNDARLPSGKHAPLFSQYWKLTSKKNKNDKGTFFILGEGKNASIEKEGWVSKDVYMNNVKDLLSTVGDAFDRVGIAQPEATQQITDGTVPDTSKY